MTTSWDIGLAGTCDSVDFECIVSAWSEIMYHRQPEVPNRVFTFVEVLVSALDGQRQAGCTLEDLGDVHSGAIAISLMNQSVDVDDMDEVGGSGNFSDRVT
jgi:hypothetical protein